MIMSNFDDNRNIKKYKDSNLVKRLAKYMKPVLPQFIIALFLTIIIVIIDLLPAFLEGNIIGILQIDLASTKSSDKFLIDICNNLMDKYSIDLKTCQYYIALALVGFYVFVIIIGAIINYICQLILQKSGQKIVMNLRRDVFWHIESLSIAQINRTPIGKFVTRVTSDINQINELYTSVVVNLIKYTLTIVFVLVLMLIISPILTLYLSAVFAVLIVITFIFNKVSRRQYRKVRGSVSNVNAFLSENITGMKTIQVFNQEDKKYNEFREKNNELKKNSVKEVLVFAVFRPMIYALYIISEMIVLYNGLFLIKNNKLSVSNYISYYKYTLSFFNPIQQLAEQFNMMQSAFAGAERVFEILDTKIEIEDSEDAIEIDHIDGKIEFRNVWFKYDENDWVLKDVSFTLNPKESLAIVGATGAGKTTILSLIVRNYEVNKGEILIDDIPIKKIKIASLRKKIGQMLQDVFLFSGDIKSNITLKEDTISDTDVNEAIKLVNADKFINKLDDGINYKVLEGGKNFSSGQRQLISFARTIVHKPSIMILDEATSNIDTETEVLIQDSLKKMMNVSTMLIVAHRLSTIQHATKIIVLQKGEIKEMGNHQSLLKKHGLYYNLYRLQYKDQEI